MLPTNNRNTNITQNLPGENINNESNQNANQTQNHNPRVKQTSIQHYVNRKDLEIRN